MEVGVWGYVNHTAKQIVPFRAKNYQQLDTIKIFGKYRRGKLKRN